MLSVLSDCGDPITLEVVCEGLRAIVKKMRATIIRASFSSVIYELDDFSCALFNPDAEMGTQFDARSASEPAQMRRIWPH